MSDIHAAAHGFEAGATAYERGRPDYPAEVAGWLTGTLGLASGKTVLDLGAGTGKFTRYLAATGATVIAVEPVEGMRAKLIAALPQVQAVAGTAEAIPLPDASVDVVLCAQAFHWFATKAALIEISRVLKPGGRLGLIWNMRDEARPWVEAISEIIRPYEGDAPRAYKGTWKEAFPVPTLSPLDLQRFAYEHTGTPEDVIVNRTLSTSFIAKLPDEEREQVARRLRDLIAAHPDLAGKPDVTYPYVTEAYAATRL
ncbi:MAG TPA: methyltransferase domain-containing protein [Devosia sp.]